MVVGALTYLVGMLFMRGGRNQDAEVLAGGRPRPLVFGPSTKALAGTLPCTAAARAAQTKLLRQAGYYHRLAFEEFASLRNVLTIGWVLFIGTLIVLFTDPHQPAVPKLLAVGVAGALLFYGMPRLLLHSKASARLQRIEYALPDALDLTSMCVTGGLPLSQAFRRVGEELGKPHPDLACELRILARQTEAGSLDHALRQFAERVDTPEVLSLAAIIGQTEKQGSNVVAAFQNFADQVRYDRRQRAEEHGSKTTVKMLFPLVFCLAPPVYMMLLAPAVIELRTFVLQENRPGGILSPSEDLLSNATATPDRDENSARRSPFGDYGIPSSP
jgi:tight adherence protein C